MNEFQLSAPADFGPDEPSTNFRATGPQFPPTHHLADQPAVAPARDVDTFVQEFLEELNFGQGVPLDRSTINHQYLALASTVRSYLMADWLDTAARRRAHPAKMVGYLSAEYLLGRQLGNALLNSDLEGIVEEAMRQLGIDLAAVRAQEVEPGLGNGGLGRLAACFVDSLATMDVSCIGYGIRYEYGIFRQTFVEGRQVEVPDTWLALGAPWEFRNPERAVQVDFGGSVESYADDQGRLRRRWRPDWNVLAVPYNYMVPGYHNGVANTLRLWSAEATRAFDLQIFNHGDYAEAVRAQTFAENISKVLYPEDSTPQGKELRLQQQYFFVAASIGDYLHGTLPVDFDLARLPEQIIFQLNDTHPVIGIPELMRLLIDVHGMEGDRAWAITSRCFADTCHTLRPEALEVWPVSLVQRLLPRHMEIIFEINDRLLDTVRERFPGDEDRVRRMSIIAEDGDRGVRMAHLATVAAVRVNGVAELHSQLLRDKVLVDFAQLWPEKFTNVTNGVTPRRFLVSANPPLTSLINDAIGDGWITDLERLRELEPYAEDPVFRERFRSAKRANKDHLNSTLLAAGTAQLPADHMLDVMVKRLHEYKRQMLKLLHIVSTYEAVLSGRVRHQRRSQTRRPALRCLPAQLQRHPGAAADPSRRPLRADLAGRQGGLRHRQHEARAQRGPDDRHRRRRQCRDPQTGRRRQLLPLRNAGAGGRRVADARISPRRDLCVESGAEVRHRPDRQRTLRRPGSLASTDGRLGRQRPFHGARRLPGLRRRSGSGGCEIRGHRSLDALGHSQCRPLRLFLIRPFDARVH